MAAVSRAATSAVDDRRERYLAAEHALWAHYGLDPDERFIQIAEPATRLRILESGPAKGRPVLFLPGTGGTGPYWAPIVNELPSVRSLMLDRPGWGLSAPVDYRGRDYGRTVTSILTGALDAMGITRVDLIGASIGNLWALRFALYAPERVGRIALLGGGPGADVEVPMFIKLLATPIGALIVRLPFSPKTARAQVAALGHGPSLAAGRLDDFIDWRVAFARYTDSMHHERAMVRAVLGRTGWRPGFIPTDAEISAIQHPVRMLFGSEDPTGSVEVWQRFAQRLPNGELQVLDGAGHMPWWDDPVSVGRSVREFLSDSSAASG
jgi:pimeloyl-ACP methyl ester carboxylesterase